MRILLVVDCYYPETKSSARLVHDLALEMQRQRNEVVVLTPSEHIHENLEITHEDGALIARVKTGRIKGASNMLRAVRENNLSRTLWNHSRSFFEDYPCDLIVFYSPSIFFGGLVNKLKALWRCPAYLILRDIFPQWAVDVGVMKKGLAYRYFRMKELEQYAAADVIGVQSPANLDYFAKDLAGKNYQLEVVYNWMTLKEEAPPPSNYRQALGLQDKTVFFYGGNIGLAQDMDNILRLARSLKSDPRLHFLLVGEGSESSKVAATIETEGLKNIQLLPPVGQQEYQAMLAEFDIGLISLDKKLRTQNFPGKILGYMYHSMPMLCSLNPGNDLHELLWEHEAGMSCFNGQDDILRAYALRLAKNAMLRKKIGSNGRRLLEKYFSVEVAVQQIMSHFQHAPVFQYSDQRKPEIPLEAAVGGRFR